MSNELLEDPDFAACEAGRALRDQPLGFVDVGARGGVHSMIDPLAEATAVLAFDADRAECERLARQMAEQRLYAAHRVEPVAIARQKGTADLFVYSSAVNCSLMLPNQELMRRYRVAGFELLETVKVPTTSLDEVVFGGPDDGQTWGELIKLDTQGTSLDILEGATRTLRERTVALMVEAEFLEIYRGQRLFSELETWLSRQGFSLYGIDPHYRSTKLLDKRRSCGRERTIYADAIFLKDPLAAGNWREPLSRRAQHALFVSALLLGYHDFALELALATWATGADGERARRLVQRVASQRAQRAYDDVKALWERVSADPAQANVAVGKFVDARRHVADYDDVKS